jgi:hypothetical protein
MYINKELTEDDTVIADTFNTYFVDKIELLKKGVDKSMVDDPLKKMKERPIADKSSFKLRPIDKKILKEMFYYFFYEMLYYISKLVKD